MNDPLKDFVEQHRAEFDHLDAPAFRSGQLRKEAQPVTEKKKIVLLVGATKWLVAASVLLALTATWFVFSNKNADQSSMVAIQKEVPANKDMDKSISKELDSEVMPKSLPITIHTVALVEQKKPRPDIYAGLKDSTSASTRLLAILEIEKSGNINNYILDRLALTLNHDRNTNVRLAALSLMETYRDDAHVSTLLVNSLNTQNDPIVQLGLVSLLGKMENVKIDGQLHALANNPETFAAVRDEAYNILLNQNKL